MMSQREIERLLSSIDDEKDNNKSDFDNNFEDDEFLNALMNGNFNDDVPSIKKEETPKTMPIKEEIKSKPISTPPVIKKDEPKQIIKKEVLDESLIKKDEIIKSSDNKKDDFNNLTTIISDIENIQKNKVIDKKIENDVIIEKKDDNENVQKNINEKIEKGIFPLPVQPQTKVVNQLNEVANDSEEKASMIFDTLSFICDENDVIIKINKENIKFLKEQEIMFNQLIIKFNNIDIFKKEKEKVLKQIENLSNINNKLINVNNKIFGAMELMQFNDINRQKIERVMSVIRKLSVYLNNIFEDTNANKEIATAKYIHGDSSNELVTDDDIEKLINEYH